MTDVSNVVPYYSGFAYHRQGVQQSPPGAEQLSSPSVSPGQTAGSPQAQQQFPMHPGQQHAATAVEGQQCSWYGYGHVHSVAAAAAAHQHQQNVAAAAQQYFEHDMSLWSAAAVAGQSYLQYQHHQGYQQQLQQHHQAHQQQQQQQQQQQTQQQQQQQQAQQQLQISGVQGQIEWSGDEGNNSGVGTGEPSPTITVSGSEMSSPGTPASPPTNNNTSAPRSGQSRSPYEWMKKTQYHPNPGKTRTKDKYRVVYTESQRLELEKEFYSSKYITIRRKTELAKILSLSERQVKIWFQNRRAKERKQNKKRGELEQQQVQQQQQQRDIKPIVDMHGVAHPAHPAHPTHAAVAAAHHPPIASMANLSLGGMNAMLGGLMPGSPSPSLMGHHHHHQAAAAAAAHHAILAASAAGHPHHAHASHAPHAAPQSHSVLGI